MRAWKISLGIACGVTAVFLPALGYRWWLDRGEWFPMKVGDRWTYRDDRGGPKVVFETLLREAGGEFIVERRIGATSVRFVLSVTSDSVLLLGASGEPFDPPFEEFRLPPAGADEWSYDGRLGTRAVQATSRRVQAHRRRFEVEERSSLSGRTTFTVERGKGVVRLVGKRTDIHSSGVSSFDWILESFERRG